MLTKEPAALSRFTELILLFPVSLILPIPAAKHFNGDSKTKRRLVGFFADASLGYKNFAFLNVTGRKDLTSTLPYENAQYFYPVFPDHWFGQMHSNLNPVG